MQIDKPVMQNFVYEDTDFNRNIKNNLSAQQNMPFHIISAAGRQTAPHISSREMTHGRFSLVMSDSISKRHTPISYSISGAAQEHRTPETGNKTVFQISDRVYARQDSIEIEGKPRIRISLSESREAFEADAQRLEPTANPKFRLEFKNPDGLLSLTDQSRHIEADGGEAVEIMGWDDIIGSRSKEANVRLHDGYRLDINYHDTPAHPWQFDRTTVAFDALPDNFTSLPKEQQLPYWDAISSLEQSILESMYMGDMNNTALSAIERLQAMLTLQNVGVLPPGEVMR